LTCGKLVIPAAVVQAEEVNEVPEKLMWPKEYAHKDSVGKPYRPSNGTESDIFMGTWCRGCRKNSWCRIIDRSMIFDEEDKGYPRALRIGDNGQPECTSFEEPGTEPKKRRRKESFPLFGE
jgi:hypothetical protein